jgi:hypothetical protein
LKNSKAGDPRAKWRSILVAELLILVALLSAGSGIYAGASFFAQQAPNVTITTTIYTTTTSLTTSTIWSTTTAVVQGILTTVAYTTSTSTITVTASTSSSTTATTSTSIGTTVTITQLTGSSGKVTVKGYLKDAKGNGLSGLQVRITVDAGYTGRVTTTTGGAFSYAGSAPTSTGSHVVTVWFDGTTQYVKSSASSSYRI